MREQRLVVTAVWMAAACFGAGDQGQQMAGPDVVVYVDNGTLVPPDVMLGAKETASRMFAGIGLRVQWTFRRPAQVKESAGTRCAPVQPEAIVIRMASKRSAATAGEAMASALPYARTGIRITIFYSELQEATHRRPGLEPMLLAHVLVHEITHVMQRVGRHSSEGVMRAHWTIGDYAGMREKPLEFTADDADLIRKGLAQRKAEACTSAVAAVDLP